MDISETTIKKIETTLNRTEVEEILAMAFRLEANLPPSADVDFTWSANGTVDIVLTSENTRTLNRVSEAR